MRKNSAQYPLNEDGTDRVGSAARDIEYTQLRGNSMDFPYYQHPAEAYYIDGEHDYLHCHYESFSVLCLSPKLAVWHDSDMEEVAQAIDKAEETFIDYTFYRVTDTRIAYAVRK